MRACVPGSPLPSLRARRPARRLQCRPPLRGRSILPGVGGVLDILDVRANFRPVGAGANVGVQVGDDGVVVVDAGSAVNATAVVAAVKRITPKPIRYIIDTGPDADHVGGNEVLSKAGETFFPNTRIAGQQRDFMGPVAAILAFEGVLQRMSAASASTPAYPTGGWPTETFHYARKYIYLNGEAIEVLHQPAAHTDSECRFSGYPCLDGRRRPRPRSSRDRRRAGGAPGDSRRSTGFRAGDRLGPMCRRSGHYRGPRHGGFYDSSDDGYRTVTIVPAGLRDLIGPGCRSRRKSLAPQAMRAATACGRRVDTDRLSRRLPALVKDKP